MRCSIICWGVVCAVLIALVGCGMETGGGKVGRAQVSADAVSGFLAEYGLDVPGVAAEIARTVSSGQRYSGKVKDRKGKSTALRAWVESDQQNVLCMTFYRDEVCPDCKGTGRRAMPDILDSKISATIAFTCQTCDGKGMLKNQFNKRCWALSGGDYSSKEAATEARQSNVLRGAPAGAERYVEMLSSTEPAQRLEACLWLDRNYLKPGVFFRDITPILDRARYTGRVDDRSLASTVLGKRIGDSGETVYQFWAGKGIPAEEAERAYYRVFINNADGRIVRTAFAPDSTTRQPSRPGRN